MAEILKKGRGTLLAKLNIKQAYRNIRDLTKPSERGAPPFFLRQIIFDVV